MALPATIADFKARFARDFPFGTGLDAVQDQDITNALNDAQTLWNPELWDPVTEAKTAYLFVTAHFLVLNIRAAGGLTTGKGKGINSYGGGTMNSKGVGSVSVGYTPPDEIAQNAILAGLMQTGYGQKYLQMATPRLVGNGVTVAGWNDTGAPDGS